MSRSRVKGSREEGYIIFHMGRGEYMCFEENGDYYWGDGSDYDGRAIDMFDLSSIEKSIPYIKLFIDCELLTEEELESGLIWAFACVWTYENLVESINFFDGFKL